jgi:hypothetical protein
MASLDELEDVPVIERNIKFPQQRHVFIPEGLFLMMMLLPLNVSNDRVKLRVPIGKCPVTFLPIESSPNESLLINKIRRIGLNFTNQVRLCHCWF